MPTVSGQDWTVTDTAQTPKGKKAVTNASSQLLAANTSRIEIFVHNVGANDAYLCLGAAAAVKEEGIYLKKEGGAVCITGYTGPITCITAAGETTLSYTEI